MSTALRGHTPPIPRSLLSTARRARARLGLVTGLTAALLAIASCSATLAPAASPATAAGPASAGPLALASPQSAGTAPSGSPAAADSSAIPVPTFPLTLTDDEGTSVTIPVAPERIVSLAPSVTETLFALGEGSRVVGVTDSDDYPPAAKALPHVASYTGVQIEKVVAQRPDLVIAWKGITSVEDIAKMRSLHLPVVVLYATTVEKVIADIGLVGQATGEPGPAQAVTSALTADVQAIHAAATAAGPAPRVFYEIDATKQIYGPAPDDFTTDMIRLAGGDPITSGTAGVYAISLERLVAADPQVIVLGDFNYGTTAATVAARPGWGGMTAVKAGALRPIDDTIVTRPGPRIADGLAALAEAIHPGLVLPSLPPSPSTAP